MTVPETPDLDLDAIQRTFRHATTCAVRRASAGGDYLRACDCGRDDRLIASLRAAQTERDRLRGDDFLHTCPACGDGMMWHERYKAWWCVGCSTPATFRERAATADMPEAKMRYERAAERKEGK